MVDYQYINVFAKSMMLNQENPAIRINIKLNKFHDVGEIINFVSSLKID